MQTYVIDYMKLCSLLQAAPKSNYVLDAINQLELRPEPYHAPSVSIPTVDWNRWNAIAIWVEEIIGGINERNRNS